MYNYIYELLQAPVPEDEWTRAWEYHEHPDAFPIADTEDRGTESFCHLFKGFSLLRFVSIEVV